MLALPLAAIPVLMGDLGAIRVIVRRYENVPVEHLEDRELRALIDTKGISLGRLSLAEETFQPGQYNPPQHHYGLEEVYHVKAGQGCMHVGD